MSSPHNYSSFDYKITHPQIRRILNKRAELDNTIQVGMPFIKATTTIQHPEYLKDGVGFTLGLHAINTDANHLDIFSGGADKNVPLVGYTYVNGKNEYVYAEPPVTANSFVKDLFDLFSQGTQPITTPGAAKIPPPGITRATIARNKNGLLAAARLEIAVPTLTQLEFLHRVFLVPGIGMVVEWGQQFAPSDQFGQTGLNDATIQQNMFPWYDRPRLDVMLERLARSQVGLQEILNCYTYPTEGQYAWLFARVANFSVKSNADGSYNVSVHAVGPSEDSFAYDTHTTVLPPKATKDDVICVGDTNNVNQYFTSTASGVNLKTLLDGVRSKTTLPLWADHVIKITNGNKTEGEPEKDDKDTNVSQKSFGEGDDAYFMTWRFLVNVVLNHPEHGVFGIYKRALDSVSLENITLLNPYGISFAGRRAPYVEVPGDTYLDDPLESYVGYNQYLRSIDPGILVIVNEPAVTLAEQVLQKNRLEEKAREFLPPLGRSNPDVQKFTKIGTFDKSTQNVALEVSRTPTDASPTAIGSTLTPSSTFSQPRTFTDSTPIAADPITATLDTNLASDKQDKGLLSAGVWINHRAVVESIAGAGTILRGVSNLLQQMSGATSNYWQLALDSSEPQGLDTCTGDASPTNEKLRWTVIDINYKPNGVRAVNNCLGKIHTFNKLSSTRADGIRVGSEVTDCTVDLSLPKLMFAQIATMGLVQDQDLRSAGVELDAAESNELRSNCTNALVSDSNDALRQMFGITSLSTKLSGGQSPDRTILPRAAPRTSTCTSTNTQSTGEAGGVGGAQGDVGIGTSQEDVDTLKEETEKLIASEACKKCKQCEPQITPPSPTPIQTTQAPLPVTTSPPVVSGLCSRLSNRTEQTVCFAAQADGITDPAELAQFLAQLGHESNNWTRTLEQASGKAYEGRTDLGNTQPGDGVRFKGRAYIQLTGRANYEAAGKALGIDTLNNPQILETVEAATRVSLWFWKVNVRPGMTRGRTRGSIKWPPNNSYTDTVSVTKIINGGQNGIADRRNRFGRIYGLFTASSTNSTQNTTQTTNTATLPPTVTPPVQTSAQETSPQTQCTDEFYRNLARDRGILINRVARAKSFCEDCNRAPKVLEQIQKTAAGRTTVTDALAGANREFPHLNDIFRYYEMFPTLMVANIRCDANGDKSNAFGASPASLALSADITLPGISGLRVGELFWIDRIPAFYRAFGAFQIMSVDDTIDAGGWQSKIHAYFNYLGKPWTEAVLRTAESIGNV